MNLLKFLLTNWDSVLIVIALAAANLISAGRKWQSVLKSIVFGLVTQAEREYGKGTGALKLASVIEKLYPHIPFFLRELFTTKDFEKWIDAALAEARLKWEKNPKLIEGSPNQAEEAQHG